MNSVLTGAVIDHTAVALDRSVHEGGGDGERGEDGDDGGGDGEDVHFTSAVN